LRSRLKLTREEAREVRELEWERLLAICLEILDKDRTGEAGDAKAAPWKVAVAAWMKGHAGCANGWLGEKLNMGVESGVSRYVSELNAAKNPSANKLYELLCAKIKY
jgi:hypothetical protein